jgi:hypothetical protein
MSKTLTIDVPEALYARLERRAQMNQRSLDDEVIHVLEATTDVDVDREALWERIRRRRERLPTVAWDPEELKRKIREGRK